MAEFKTKTSSQGASKASKTVSIEQIASPARREASQTGTLIGLGLNKLHRKRTLEDTPAIRGMINKVRHMVRVIEG